MPPFNKQSNQGSTPRQAKTTPERSLEDFAKEIFGQLEQKKAEVERNIEPAQQIEPAQLEKKVERSARIMKVPDSVDVRASVRPNIEQSTRVAQMKERETAVFTPPTTKKALVQAIVAAEILGPPKAKQQRVR